MVIFCWMEARNIFRYIWDGIGSIQKPSVSTSRVSCKYAALTLHAEYQKAIGEMIHYCPTPEFSFSHEALEARVTGVYDDVNLTPYDLMVLVLTEERSEDTTESDARELRGVRLRQRVGLPVSESNLTHWVHEVKKIDQPSSQDVEELLLKYRRPLVATIPDSNEPDDLHHVVLIGVYSPIAGINPYNVDLSGSYFIYQTSLPEQTPWYDGNGYLGRGLGVVDATAVMQVCYTVSYPPSELFKHSLEDYMRDDKLVEALDMEKARENYAFLLRSRRGQRG